MSRIGIMQDIPAHICWRYIHGELNSRQKQEVLDIIIIAIPDEWLAIQMIREIAYRVGFANSVFPKVMSEITYKLKKQWCRNQINEVFSKRRDDAT
jgi:hypothetical protein